MLGGIEYPDLGNGSGLDLSDNPYCLAIGVREEVSPLGGLQVCNRRMPILREEV